MAARDNSTVNIYRCMAYLSRVLKQGNIITVLSAKRLYNQPFCLAIRAASIRFVAFSLLMASDR